MTRNQPVRVLSFVGPALDRDWTQTAKIVRREAGFLDGNWYIVRFDKDGARIGIHAERLMAQNVEG
jgi:hypothetical protein